MITMIHEVNKHKGKSSILFVVLCTMLFCFSVFLFYQFNSERVTRNSIEQAEFEATYGKTSGSAPDYKMQEAAIQHEKKLKREKQATLKAEWLARLDAAMQVQNYDQLEQIISDLKQSSIQQNYGIQVLFETIEAAVFDYKDAELVKAITNSGSPWIDCQLDSQPGQDFLERALNMSDTVPLQTLIDAGCMHFNNRFASKKLISYILNADEPKRHDVFKTFASNKVLQKSVIQSLLKKNQQQSIVDYISAGTLSKDLYIGKTSLLGYSIEKQNTLLTNYLIDVGAVAKGKSYGGEHALMKAIKQNDLALVEKVANLSPNDLDDSEFARIVFQAVKDDIKADTTRILFSSNPKLIDNETLVRGLLQEGVLTSDLQQVEFLLEQGANPNTFVGRSTLLKAALDKSPVVLPEITELLREHGATEDPLDVVRQLKGVDKNAKCDFSQAGIVDGSVFSEGYHLLSERYSAKKNDLTELSNITRCEAGVVYCKEQGHGVDACMASISNCGSSNEGLCCELEVKNKYFEGRCAGFGVTEAIMWLNAFQSTYGIPTNFQ